MKKLFLFLLLTFLTAVSFAKEKTCSQIGELYGDTIVTVNVIKKDGATYSGTGFIVETDGVIATAGHVIKDAVAINFTFKNGIVSPKAELIAVSKQETVDLALLKIPQSNLPYVFLGNSDEVSAGQEITVIGNPRRLQNTITNGLISQLRQISPKVIWQQISAPISPSSSGSPVFNKKGEVIGIAMSSLKGEENQNINFAIPSKYLIELMRENDISPAIMPASTEARTYFCGVKSYISNAWNILKEQISFIFK